MLSRKVRRIGVALLAAGAVGFIHAVPSASAHGDRDGGHVWVDSLSAISSTAAHDPHLPCDNVAVWASGLSDASGALSLDGWRPTGFGKGDQAFLGTAGHPQAFPWNYNTSQGGAQIVAIIPAAIVVSHASLNGDKPKPGEGYHFKLFFSDPHKSATFWLGC